MIIVNKYKLIVNLSGFFLVPFQEQSFQNRNI